MNNSFPSQTGSGVDEARWGLIKFAAVFYLPMALVALAWTGLWDHRWAWVVPPDQVWNAPFFNMLGPWGRTSLGLVAGISFGGLVAGLSRLASGRVAWLDAMEEGFCDLLGPIRNIRTLWRVRGCVLVGNCQVWLDQCQVLATTGKLEIRVQLARRIGPVLV